MRLEETFESYRIDRVDDSLSPSIDGARVQFDFWSSRRTTLEL